ncbi:ATP-binding protein [Neolewinella antarctica]|uniref:AAA+ ATPase domain-containing protein n=1 Tax=Neolewinella antarctica TaxID=442734 RepID=A0ABX0X622_9BACT|nr:ATP-binding protein [Neolewinella antarctica]NJC24661.1 hypothetical protein [Neolewinella antarctica]
MTKLITYIPAVELALDYLFAVLEHQMVPNEVPRPARPEFVDDGSPFARFIEIFKPTAAELLALCLALSPHLRPGALDAIVRQHLPDGGEMPAFGGVRGQSYRGILPTGQTLLFLLSSRPGGALGPLSGLAGASRVLKLLRIGSRLVNAKLLSLEPPPRGEPVLSGKLVVNEAWLGELLDVGEAIPACGPDFPAEVLRPVLGWPDIVLPPTTAGELERLRRHLGQFERLSRLPGLGKYLRPGYRGLFHGPPGTGKTLVAGLLGEELGRPVLRVDLSGIVSKYIGETEKHLASLFDRAADRRWILFFDEADALFGKRSETKESKDRYANQEISYLLQRVESFPGIVLLATNFRENLDAAFSRRFEAIVAFQPPGAAERLRLYEAMWPTAVGVDPETNLAEVAGRYALSGGQVAGALRFATAEWLADGGTGPIMHADLLAGVAGEFGKVGWMFKG